MNWMSREDYIDRLSKGCCISVGRAQVATDAALASKSVQRQGWFSSEYRAGLMEHGEPDPGPGPCELPLAPQRPFWLERNMMERVEYSVEDLDYETREHWRTVNTGEPEVTTAINAALPANVGSDRSDQIDRGGRPNVIENRVKDWLAARSSNENALRSQKLAMIYKAEFPLQPGSEEYIRKVIAKWKKSQWQKPG